MPQLFQKYWYKDEPILKRAFLCNLRDADVRRGGAIRQGDILVGQCGFAAAELNAAGFAGRTVEYLPNRCVEWQGYYLTCMALDGLPAGSNLKGQRAALRHKHYVIAELPNAKATAHARSVGLPAITSHGGHSLVNLEIFTVPGRTPVYRRAKLL